MLQYIDSFRAHEWKEVTDLYDRHVHEQKMEEEARKQTDISRQIHNAARAAAAGVWLRR